MSNGKRRTGTGSGKGRKAEDFRRKERSYLPEKGLKAQASGKFVTKQALH